MLIGDINTIASLPHDPYLKIKIEQQHNRLRQASETAEPPEPSLLSCAREVLSLLGELAATQENSSMGLFLQEPTSAPPGKEAQPVENSLEGALRRSVVLARHLVSQARAMQERLIG